MPDRALKNGFEPEEGFASLTPEDSLQVWEGVDFCLPVGMEECTISAETRAVVHDDPTSAGADKFRLAQLRLKSLQAARRLKSILITSPLPGDGKSTIALNLATVLSENGNVPVLLLEADVYRPTLVKRLGLKPWAGLTECYRRGEDPMLAMRRINPLGFYLLPAGQPVEDGVNLLQSNFTSQLLSSLSSSAFKWILIDSTPTTPTAEVLALREKTDATLLVVRAGKTPQEVIEESVLSLGRDHIVGIILNGVEGLNQAYSKYYGYGHRKSDARAKPTKPENLAGLRLNEHSK
jgi:Mrp family chromosome partitioning ATPase